MNEINDYGMRLSNALAQLGNGGTLRLELDGVDSVLRVEQIDVARMKTGPVLESRGQVPEWAA